MRHLRDGAWRAHLVDFIIGALVVLLVCYLLVIAATVVWMAAPVWIVGLVLAILAPLLHLGMLVGSVRDGVGIHRLGRLTESPDRVEFKIDSARAARSWSPALVGALGVLGYAVGAGVAFYAMGGASWISPELHGLPHQLIYPAVVAPVWLVRFAYRPIYNHGVARLESGLRQHVERLASDPAVGGAKHNLDRERSLAERLRELERYWGGTRLGPRLTELDQALVQAEKGIGYAPTAKAIAAALEREVGALLQITQRHGAYRKWVVQHGPVVEASGFRAWAQQLTCIEAAIESPGLRSEVKAGQYAKVTHRLEEIAKLLGMLSFMMEADQSTSRRADYRGPRPGPDSRHDHQEPHEPPPEEEPRPGDRSGPKHEDRKAGSGVKTHDLAWAFGVLHLPTDATFEEARKSHRHLVKYFHPDAGNVGSDEAMKEINEAWNLVQAHLAPR